MENGTRIHSNFANNDNGIISDTKKLCDSTSTDDQKAYAANLSTHRPGISTDEVVKAYNQWAVRGTYEKDLCQDRYRGPMVAAETLSSYLNSDLRDTVRILDMAAGTGYVGEQLKIHGFSKVDALDPAESMLAIARSKSVYQKYICDRLSEKETCICDDTYDAVVTSGGMGEGHIPCCGLKEMIRITKPGGIVCIVMRQEYLEYVKEYKNRLEPFMDELEKGNYWRHLQKTVVYPYSFNKPGNVYVYEVCISGSVNC